MWSFVDINNRAEKHVSSQILVWVVSSLDVVVQLHQFWEVLTMPAIADHQVGYLLARLQQQLLRTHIAVV